MEPLAAMASSGKILRRNEMVGGLMGERLLVE